MPRRLAISAEQRLDLVLDAGFVVATVLDEVDGARRVGPGVDEEVAYLIVDHVVLREPEDGLVEGLHRARIGRDEPLGAGERGVEARVAKHQQRTVAFEVRQAEPGLGDHAERALASGDELGEIDGQSIGRRHVHEVVPGHVAPQLREGARDVFAARSGNLANELVCLPDQAGLRADGVELGAADARGPVHDPSEQHDLEVENVLAGLAVTARALTAGVGRDHAAERGPVGGREVGRKVDAVRFEERVQVVQDDARLHTDEPALEVECEDLRHVTRQIHHDAVREGLAVGARAAATRRQRDLVETRLIDEPKRERDVGRFAWEDHRGRQHLVDAVVGRGRETRRIVGADLSPEAAALQSRDEAGDVRIEARERVEARDDGGLHACACLPRAAYLGAHSRDRGGGGRWRRVEWVEESAPARAPGSCGGGFM